MWAGKHFLNFGLPSIFFCCFGAASVDKLFSRSDFPCRCFGMVLCKRKRLDTSSDNSLCNLDVRDYLIELDFGTLFMG